MALIETDGLTKNFGKVTAVDDLDLTVESEQLFGFIGPNGAGKSTTINLLTGQIEPTSGDCRVMGNDPVKNPVEVREKIGILPEREDPPTFFTPREYFEFVAKVRNVENIQDRIEEWAKRLKFEDKLDVMNKDLSKGEKQKVMVTQTFLHEPELVFIDEPLINLDPEIQERIKKYSLDYREEGNTIFLSTHVMSLADEICTHIGLISGGKLVVSGEKESLKEEGEDLTDVFLRLVEEYGTSQEDD